MTALQTRIAKAKGELAKEQAKGRQANERRCALLRLEILELESDKKPLTYKGVRCNPKKMGDVP